LVWIVLFFTPVNYPFHRSLVLTRLFCRLLFHLIVEFSPGALHFFFPTHKILCGLRLLVDSLRRFLYEGFFCGENSNVPLLFPFRVEEVVLEDGRCAPLFPPAFPFSWLFFPAVLGSLPVEVWRSHFFKFFLVTAYNTTQPLSPVVGGIRNV